MKKHLLTTILLFLFLTSCGAKTDWKLKFPKEEIWAIKFSSANHYIAFLESHKMKEISIYNDDFALLQRISADIVRFCLTDRLWIINYDFQLESYDPESGENLTNSGLQNPSRVLNCGVGNNGTLTVWGDDWLADFHASSGWNYVGLPDEVNYPVLTQDDSGVYWIEDQGNFYYYTEDEWHYFNSIPVNGSYRIKVFDRNIWLACEGKLFRFPIDNNSPELVREFQALVAVRDIIQDEKGIVWIASVEGIWSYQNGQLLKQYNVPIRRNFITDMTFYPKLNTFFVASTQGVFYMEMSK